MKHVKHYQSTIKNIIRQDLDSNINFTDESRKASEYALISGKRLRPMIQMAICNSSNNSLALFVEYQHNASLIIDDLPCMDNDTERRGQPTLHVKYGQHIAHLVAYNLMVTAMKHLSDGLGKLRNLYSPEQYEKMEILANREISENLGFKGICGGQLLDLTDDNIEDLSDRLQKERVLRVARLKTGCLFSLSFILGWISRSSDLTKISVMKEVGMSFGLCYQIVDDLRDFKSDKEKNNARNNICRYFTRNELIDLFIANINNYEFKMKLLECYCPLMQELHKYLTESFRKYVISEYTS